MPIAGPTYPFVNRDATLTLDSKMVSQPFQVSGGNQGFYDLTLYLIKTGSPTGSLTAVIYSDNAGEPDAPIPDGVSSSLDASTVSGVGANYTFSFASPPFLENGLTYHFVLMHNGDWNGSDFVSIGVDASAPAGFGDMYVWTENGTDWTVDLTRDITYTSQYADVVPTAPVSTDIDLDWTCDCNLQDDVQNANIEKINDWKTVLIGYIRPTLEIYSPYFPSSGRWESEWLLKGNDLPIPDGTKMLWYDTYNNRFGGEYTIVNGEIETVKFYLPPGSRYGFAMYGTVTNAQTNLSNTYGGATVGDIAMGSNVLVPSRLHFVAPIYVNGQILWSYFFGATNVYTTQFGVAGSYSQSPNFAGFSPFLIRWRHYDLLSVGALSWSIKLIAAAGTPQFQIMRQPVSTTTTILSQTTGGFPFSYLVAE